MATYIELFRLANDAPFRERVQYALWSVAAEKLGTGTAGEKLAAKKFLRGFADGDVILALTIRCTADATIAAAGNAATDASIRAVVATAFADVAA